MRPALFCVVFFLSVMMSVGSRLGNLEAEMKNLKSFIFTELGYIRVEVKEISNRVEILENITVTQEPNIPNLDIQVGKNKVRGENYTASQVVTADVENIHKAFKNEKKDLHKLKTDAQDQLRDLEKRIDTHLETLTSEVQQNIKFIHKNISLANASLLQVINASTANVSNLSYNLRIELADFVANTSEKLSLRLNETEAKMKQNITTTFRQNEDKLQSFIALANRNMSEIILKADSIISLIRTNFSEIPTQITNVSLELNTVEQKVYSVEEKLLKDLESASSYLQEQITNMFPCSEYIIRLKNGTNHDGHYFACVAKDIRLANASLYGSSGVQGRLEVRHNDVWGTVCDDSFQIDSVPIGKNVNVVCKTFGFRECEYVLKAGLGEGSGDIFMDNVKCDGAERSFMDCPHPGWGVHNCEHKEDVGLRMWI